MNTLSVPCFLSVRRSTASRTPTRVLNGRVSAAVAPPPPVGLSVEDRVIGTLLAGVLASLSKERAFEATLVSEGTAEALVMLTRQAYGTADSEGDNRAEMDSGHLRPSCALALNNLSSSGDPAVRTRVAAGESAGVQRGCLLSYLKHMWRPSMRLPVASMPLLLP